MNDYDWLLDSHRHWNNCVSVCMVEDDCNGVWSRMIGYDIAIIAGGHVNEPLLTTCWCVLPD